jgi:hypothetical protein
MSEIDVVKTKYVLCDRVIVLGMIFICYVVSILPSSTSNMRRDCSPLLSYIHIRCILMHALIFSSDRA